MKPYLATMSIGGRPGKPGRTYPVEIEAEDVEQALRLAREFAASHSVTWVVSVKEPERPRGAT